MEYTQELEDRWVAALRSGDWKQGMGRLKNGDKYCCLGVLHEVSGGEWRHDLGGRVVPCYQAHESSYILPDSVLRPGVQTDLAKMNDTMGLSFEEIADKIPSLNIPKAPSAPVDD